MNSQGKTTNSGSRLSLSKLRPAYGARVKRLRVGRGEGSGKGKTSGRGGKGQTARNGGGVRPGFEGGQMPLYRRISKYGFRSQSKVLGTNKYDVVNLDSLEIHFENGATVGSDELLSLGFGRTHRNLAGYKILGTGNITKKLTVKVQAVSASAKAKIEAAGGTVEIVELKA